MKEFRNNHGTVLVLQRSEELIETLERYATEQQLTAAWLSALGGSGSVTIAWYDIATKQYIDKTYSDAMEIANLTGNLAIVDGKPFWHIHGTFAGNDYATVGGHIKSLTIGLTCEILVTPLETPMTRRHDNETGLKLLCLSNNV